MTRILKGRRHDATLSHLYHQFLAAKVAFCLPELFDFQTPETQTPRGIVLKRRPEGGSDQKHIHRVLETAGRLLDSK